MSKDQHPPLEGCEGRPIRDVSELMQEVLRRARDLLDDVKAGKVHFEFNLPFGMKGSARIVVDQ